METSTDKSKVMVNATSHNRSRDLHEVQLKDINSFKYLGAALSKDSSCMSYIYIRIETATAAMVKLNRIWESKCTSFTIKVVQIPHHSHLDAQV